MKYCSNCGKAAEDSDAFCTNCGRAFAQTEGDPFNRESSPNTTYSQPSYTQTEPAQSNLAKTSMVLGIVGFFFAGFILGILAVVFAEKSKAETNGVMVSEAKTGKVCGIINIVLSVVSIVTIFITVAVGISMGIFLS